MMFVKNRGF